jgi:hypothetical protein
MLDVKALERNKQQIDKARTRLLQMIKRIENLEPLFKEFMPEYSAIVAQNYESRGKIMEGQRWIAYANPKGLEPAPRIRWKQLNGFNGTQMMETTGKMKQAVINFQYKISKNKVLFFVNGEKYFFFASDREKWGRKVFYTKEKTMPLIAWRILISLAEKYIEKGKTDE